ncbi:universal stress protein [Natronolimnobius baerhuensis]|uniref:Universal stress protein n=1 Tax=Natronolimnobius baerhuensis TaxID=253108 RepID=A0A202E8C2_9EURY|nr:universal stress protein [Natronolimnobius baerhuensis]OVE84388.1 universal stress protein [Natronolimnobius baerhuensis]
MDAPTPHSRDILDHVLVPVAHEDDATQTALALEPYDPVHVTAIHIVEKADGAPDKTPVEQSEAIAADSFAAIGTVFPDADERVKYARRVVDAIFEAADELDASAIAFRPRGGNRVVQFLSGDRSRKLVTGANRPVIALPTRDEVPSDADS